MAGGTRAGLCRLEASGPSMPDFFHDQVCVVTGGAQGVGRALSEALARRGARVYACDISDESIAHMRDVPASMSPGQITLERGDVTDRSRVEAWISRVMEREGRIDLLVNNAAFVRWKNFTEMTLEEDLLTMRVAYDGMVHCTRAVLPGMLQAGRGHVVNMGSSAGKLFVGTSSAAYAGAKAAIDGYTQTLQVELRGSGVGLTVVRPATIAGTDFFRKHVPSTRMPRLSDLVPPLSPTQVATEVLRAVEVRRQVLDIPRHLLVFYALFGLAPGLLRKLTAIGGSARTDYTKLRSGK